MTLTFAVDSQNDLYFGEDDNLAMVTGAAAVAQLCGHAAKTILGEMVLATDEGLPYFEAVWSGTPNLAIFEAALRSALLAVDGVTDITALNIAVVGGVLTYSATIVTTYGTDPVQING